MAQVEAPSLRDFTWLLWGAHLPPATLSLQLLYATEELYMPLVKHAFTIGLAMNYALYVSVLIALLLAL